MNWKPLHPGDCLELIAPASPFDLEQFHGACELLKESGFSLRTGNHVLQRNGYLCGTEPERAQDVIDAFTRRETAAVVCIRGGYGSGRLLPWLPFSRLAASPKPFIGFSDITFLHQAFQRQLGWITLHGPNAGGLHNDPVSLENVTDTLYGRNPFSWQLSDRRVLRHGMAKGVLRGGNMTCLCHLIGTVYLPDLDGAILFLEDRGEALYRLDRLMLHLKLAGHLEKLSGIVLGQFTDCHESPNIWDLVLEYTHRLQLPVIADMPFGHSIPNEVIPLGAPFLLDTGAGVFKALFNPFSSNTTG